MTTDALIAERRLHPRLDVTALGRYGPGTRSWQPCLVEDVSLGGARFVGRGAAPAGRRGLISLHMVLGGLSIRTRARVIRTEPRDGGAEYGVSFERLRGAARERLVDFLKAEGRRRLVRSAAA